MKVLFVYRHPDMGFSIGKVFKPIETEMRKYAEVDCVYMPVANYSFRGLWLNIRAARKAARQKDYDIIHITGAEHYLVPFLKSRNVVVTVHDVQSLLNGMTGIRKVLKRWMFLSTLSSAGFVTYISSNTEREVAEYVRVRRGRVVPNPVDENIVYSPKAFNKNQPVILHIGTGDNKNLIRCCQALAGVKCKMVVVGKLNDGQKKALNDNHICYENLCNLTDEQIRQLYYDCDIVSFPSTYEGFGMPIIEGQKAGRVVVTSNLEPMNEVTGQCAVLVDPYDVEDIKRGFREAIDNSERYVHSGLENVKGYNLSRITKLYFDVYNDNSSLHTID